MKNKNIKFIDCAKYEIGIELTLSYVLSTNKYMTKYKFFDARNLYLGHSKIAANYGKYWAVGEDFYDAAEKLEAKMFAANRSKFMKIINLKTAGKTK